MYLHSLFVVLLLNCVYGSTIARVPEISIGSDDAVEPFVTIGNRFYIFSFSSPMNWYRANEFCHNLGLTLACLETKEENDLINEYILQNYNTTYREWWLGGSDLGEETTYMWTPTGQPLFYTNWGVGQPDDYNYQNCIDFYYDAASMKYIWRDNQCNWEIAFICENQAVPCLDQEREIIPEISKAASENEAVEPLVTIGNRFYFFQFNTPANWYKASEFCHKLGLTLACFETNAENDMVNDYILQNYNATYENWWLGGSDSGDEAKYMWAPTGQPIVYTNWDLDEPDNSDSQNCIDYRYNRIDMKFNWGDNNCTIMFPFICEDQTAPCLL